MWEGTLAVVAVRTTAHPPPVLQAHQHRLQLSLGQVLGHHLQGEDLVIGPTAIPPFLFTLPTLAGKLGSLSTLQPILLEYSSSTCT